MNQPIDTDEQLSGRAANALADMHDELRRRYSGLNTAEADLAEVLLNAHTSSAAGRQHLQDIQRQLIEAINNPVNALDTPAGERLFLMFLRSKIAEIQRVVDDGTLTARDQAELTRALANRYLSDDAPPVLPSPDPVPAAVRAQESAGPAPTAGMASLPSALGGLPQAAVPAATSPLASLASLLGGQGHPSPTNGESDDTAHEPDAADEDDIPDVDDSPGHDDEPPAAPGDGPSDEPGPAPTRPAAS